jgi:hypothetical protein
MHVSAILGSGSENDTSFNGSTVALVYLQPYSLISASFEPLFQVVDVMINGKTQRNLRLAWSHQQ